MMYHDWNDLYRDGKSNDFSKFSYDDEIKDNTHVKDSFFYKISDSIIFYQKNKEVVIFVEGCTFKKIITPNVGAIANVDNCQYFQTKVCSSLCRGTGVYHSQYNQNTQCLNSEGTNFINNSNFCECGAKNLNTLLKLKNSSITHLNASEIKMAYCLLLYPFGDTKINYSILMNSSAQRGSVIETQSLINIELTNCDFSCNLLGSSLVSVLDSNCLLKNCRFIKNNHIEKTFNLNFGYGVITIENCYFEDNNFEFRDNIVWNGENASSLDYSIEIFDVHNCYSMTQINTNYNQKCCDERPQLSCGCIFSFSDRYLSVISLVIMKS